MCHSWGGRATQLAAFVPELTKRGFRVVAFDAPAHGASEGRQTDMMEYSSAVAEVARHFAPVHGLIGHSFGAGNALFSWRRFHFPVERVALIGCFSNAVWITERFGELVGIPQPVIAAMRATLERRHGGELRWDSLDIGEMAREFPGAILAVHDRDDAEIPYFHAEQVLSTSGRPASSLVTTSGLGHRRIVRDAGVVKAVGEFFANGEA
jgi:alpha-beta hydrolase superfamily lysophospholipase